MGPWSVKSSCGRELDLPFLQKNRDRPRKADTEQLRFVSKPSSKMLNKPFGGMEARRQRLLDGGRFMKNRKDSR